MPGLPTEKVREMVQKGLTNEEITRSLEGQGFSLDEISGALNQSQMAIDDSGVPTGMQESTQINDIPMPNPQEQAPQDYSAAQQPAYQEPAPATEQYAPEQYAQQQDMTQYSALPQQQTSYEDIQAIVEEILEEKWKEFLKDVGDIGVWKASVSDDLEATKQEVVRTQKRLEDLQVAVLGKVREYSKSMQDLGSDMKALESVFGKIMEPLTTNIKELDKITKDLKTKTHHK